MTFDVLRTVDCVSVSHIASVFAYFDSRDVSATANPSTGRVRTFNFVSHKIAIRNGYRLWSSCVRLHIVQQPQWSAGKINRLPIVGGECSVPNGNKSKFRPLRTSICHHFAHQFMTVLCEITSVRKTDKPAAANNRIGRAQVARQSFAIQNLLVGSIETVFRRRQTGT